jgi:hypothetical protein
MERESFYICGGTFTRVARNACNFSNYLRDGKTARHKSYGMFRLRVVGRRVPLFQEVSTVFRKVYNL